MQDQEKADRPVRANVAWPRMKLHKKIGFVCGILGMIIGAVCIAWALPEKPSAALTAVATVSFGFLACYFAVKHGDQD